MKLSCVAWPETQDFSIKIFNYGNGPVCSLRFIHTFWATLIISTCTQTAGNKRSRCCCILHSARDASVSSSIVHAVVSYLLCEESKWDGTKLVYVSRARSKLCGVRRRWINKIKLSFGGRGVRLTHWDECGFVKGASVTGEASALTRTGTTGFLFWPKSVGAV